MYSELTTSSGYCENSLRMLVKMYAAATRVYIQNFRFFAGKLVVAAEKLKFGDPNDREVDSIQISVTSTPFTESSD